MRLLWFFLLTLWLVRGYTAEPSSPVATLKPRHDPPDQLFRRAPMADGARSVIVNLSPHLHYAFDSQWNRVHTVWRGAALNLWGPPYSYAKMPFICDYEGEVLFAFPQLSPWWSGTQALSTRFRSIETTDGKVQFRYELRRGENRVPVIESLSAGTQDDDWTIRREIEFPEGLSFELSFLAFAQFGATGGLEGDELHIVTTNGRLVFHARVRSQGLNWSITNDKVAYQTMRITEEATEKGFHPTTASGEEFRARVIVPPDSRPFTLEVTERHGRELPKDPATMRETSRVFAGTGEQRAPGGDEYYKIEYFPLPPEAELLITGMDWLPNGNLAVCTWLGEIYIVRNATGEVREATYHRFARGLNEPLGLTVHGGEMFVMQKGELTRVVDANHDGVADRFECVNNAWGYSGNYHSYSFGPLITPENQFYVFITGQRALYDLPRQGWALQISADGEEVTPFCSGLRVPHGWGFYGPQRDIFVTDNQGNWIGACRLNHLQRGRFYGFPSSLPAENRAHRADEVESPVLWFPRSLAPSASGFDTIQDDRFGPFKDQLLIGDFQNSTVMRACLEKVNGRWQGAVFPFTKGFLSGVNRLKMGPDGKLYVGGGKRTWSTAAPKEFSLDRVGFTKRVPFEVKEVHATADGFELLFTKAVEKEPASDPANYLVKQFTYEYHEAYGSPEFDQEGKPGATELAVAKIVVSADGKRVRLSMPHLRAGFVTSFQLAINSADDEDLRNDSFFYTLTSVPAP